MPVFTASINVCNLILIKIHLHSCLGINHFRNTWKAKNAFTVKSDAYTKIYGTLRRFLHYIWHQNHCWRTLFSAGSCRQYYYTLGKWKRNRYWRDNARLMIVMNLPQNQSSPLQQLNFLAAHFHQLKWIAIVVHHQPTHRLGKLGPSAVGWLVWIIHARIGELGEALTLERREVCSGGGEDGRLMTQPSRASELSTYHNCRQGYATKKALKVTGPNSCCWCLSRTLSRGWERNVEAEGERNAFLFVTLNCIASLDQPVLPRWSVITWHANYPSNGGFSPSAKARPASFRADGQRKTRLSHLINWYFTQHFRLREEKNANWMQRVYLSFGNDSSAADTLGWLNSSLMLSLKVDREKSMTDQKQMHATHKTNTELCTHCKNIIKQCRRNWRERNNKKNLPRKD